MFTRDEPKQKELRRWMSFTRYRKTHLIYIIFSHNLGDKPYGIPVCAAASIGAGQEGIGPKPYM